jgi:hypothetical protein
MASQIAYRAICTPTWRAARRELPRRPIVDEEALRSARRSDTVFVFGSGASLNTITDSEWMRIAAHDTFGFNWFVHEPYIRCDFHLIRQIADSNERVIWEPQIRDYCAMLESNPLYAETFLLVQHEWQARGPNLALQLEVFPQRHRVFPWRTNRDSDLSRSFQNGLVHGSSTLIDTVNAAYLLGWKHIVLVGVDLYDRRYFWLPDGTTRSVDEARSAAFDDVHTQASTGLADRLGRWRAVLETEGVRLSVYNPRSLLTTTLPLFETEWRTARPTA